MKRALVTGANSEIGASICEFLKTKYHVLALVHEHDNLVKKISGIEILPLDLGVEEEINALDKYDLIINAAAYYNDDELENILQETFMQILKINVVAPFLLAKHLNDDGIIVNISSTDGVDTYNEINIPYAASKAALNNLTKSLAYTLKSAKVYALVLGWLDTSLIREINQDYLFSEMKRTGQKRLVTFSEVTNALKDILESKYETGAMIRIDGD